MLGGFVTDAQSIKAVVANVAEKWGPWSDHNIHLGQGVYTIDPAIVSEKLRRILNVVATLVNKPLANCRILDLACLEGLYAIEFARQGARSVAIEVREANLAKARAAQQILGLTGLELFQDDVRNLSEAKHGRFDVVLCLGILYHLDHPDMFEFVKKIGAVCDRIAVIDTYVGVNRLQSYTVDGRQYLGRDVREHAPEASVDDRTKAIWSSIDNTKSVWIEKNSLCNLLLDAGFTTVFECMAPVETMKPADRVTIVAVRGEPLPIQNMPGSESRMATRLPLNHKVAISRKQQVMFELRERVTNLIPVGLRRSIKAVLQQVGILRPKRDDPYR